MGRYMLYRMHPLSVGECVRQELPAGEIRQPLKVKQSDWDALWEHGGFPEPFWRRESRFTRRWRSLRNDQLSRKEMRKVDFLVVRDRKPWFLVEAKMSDVTLSPWLAHFQSQLQAPHAFQAVVNLPYEDADCFGVKRPVIVPAKTLLSQLL